MKLDNFERDGLIVLKGALSEDDVMLIQQTLFTAAGAAHAGGISASDRRNHFQRQSQLH